MAEYWVQYYKSIQKEYDLCEKEGLMVVGEPRKRHFVSFFPSLNQVKTCKTHHSKPKSNNSFKKHYTQQVPSSPPVPSVDVLDPVVCASVIAAAFTLSGTDDHRRNWTTLVQRIVASDSPIIKIQGVATILRTFPSPALKPPANNSLGRQIKTEDISPFPHHHDFQTLTLQLIESLITMDNDLSPLLVQCLAYILRLDPQIVQASKAMDIAFHFFLNVPQIPAVRNDLAFTLETWVLKRLWTEAFNHGMESWGDRAMEWLSQAVEMVNIASGRQKDDALVIVFPPVVGRWGNG
jgi:hypothetical protein